MGSKFFVFLALIASLGAAESELVREWKDRDGNVLAKGRFWQVAEGVLKVRSDQTSKIHDIKLSQLQPEDIQYLLRSNGRVIGPTCDLLRGGYMTDFNGALVKRSKEFTEVRGTITSIVDANIAVLRVKTKSAAILCNTRKLKKNQSFHGFVKKAAGTIALPDGTDAPIYNAYFALAEEKHLRKRIRENPLPYLNQLSGHSAAYAVWLNTQRRIEHLEAVDEKRDEVKQKRADIVQENRAEQIRANLKKKISAANAKIKELKINIKRFETIKKEAKTYSDRWRNARKKISELEDRVSELEENILDYEKQIANLR